MQQIVFCMHFLQHNLKSQCMSVCAVGFREGVAKLEATFSSSVWVKVGCMLTSAGLYLTFVLQRQSFTDLINIFLVKKRLSPKNKNF